jgi:hypothetical protein
MEMDGTESENTAAVTYEQVLAATGLVTSPSAVLDWTPDMEARLPEIAELYAVGGPVSEMIIAERDGR